MEGPGGRAEVSVQCAAEQVACIMSTQPGGILRARLVEQHSAQQAGAAPLSGSLWNFTRSEHKCSQAAAACTDRWCSRRCGPASSPGPEL